MRWKIFSFNLRKLLKNIHPAFTFDSTKTAKINNILLIAGIASFAIYSNKCNLIEDKQILKIKTEMTKQLHQLKQEFGQMAIYPQIKYDVRGSTYTIQFEIDQRKCNLFQLIICFFDLYNNDSNFRIKDFKAFTKDNIVTWFIDFQQNDPQFKTPHKGTLTITGIKTNERPNFRFILQKNSLITEKNIKAVKISYKQAIKPKQLINSQQNTNKQKLGKSQQKQGKKEQNQLYKKLQEFGVTIFDPKDRSLNLDWDYLAGYQTQKRAIEDTILLALNYPQIYDEISQGTRVKYQANRPKAVLFQGPPGTGKTTSAKIISQQVNIPLIYMPIQAIMSKFYGESEKKLSDLWQLSKKLGKVIIFIDQIDALAGNRSSDMHEASRRVLSTLLRKIDSFESTTDVLLICATNRKQDLDPAMLSRIDLSIKFSLPDKQSRAAIFSRYAKHLSEEDRNFLSEETEGFSGRNISDICKRIDENILDAERKWASKLIRKQVEKKLPSLSQYLASLNERKSNQLG